MEDLKWNDVLWLAARHHCVRMAKDGVDFGHHSHSKRITLYREGKMTGSSENLTRGKDDPIRRA